MDYLFECFLNSIAHRIYRPISILFNANLLEHYKIETGSGATLVMVGFGKNVLTCNIFQQTCTNGMNINLPTRYRCLEVKRIKRKD